MIINIMTVWFANDTLFARTFGLISNILLPPLHTEKDVVMVRLEKLPVFTTFGSVPD